MARLRFSTDISDLGLFRRFAQTRKTLILTVVLGSALTWGVGLASAHYVLNVSTSVVLNLLLITANMMVVLVCAALQTILVGDMSFPGPWREQVILGKSQDRVSVKNHGAEFLMIMTVLIVANIFLVETSTGGFFDRYHHEGFFEVRLRSPDPAERKAAFEDLRDAMNFQLWERPGIQELVRSHLSDPDPDVQQAAVFCAGLMHMTDDAATLMMLAKQATPAVRAEAAVALGKFGSEDRARLLLESMLSDPDAVARQGAFRGLALMKSPLSLPALFPYFDATDLDTRLLAYWVARVIQDPDARQPLRAKLEKPLDLNEKCAVLDALKMVATKEDVLWARLQFTSAPKDVRCEPIVWEERDETQHYVTYSDTLRVKYLKIVANADSKGQVEWFERIIRDKEEEPYAREVANEVLKRLK
ncbi:MAG: HEAT repeat domain-containing protein [bacterium]